MNKVILCGIVGSYDKKEDTYAKFSIGIKKFKKNADGKAEYDNIDVTVFNTTAEYYKQWVNPKDILLIEGRLDTYKKEVNGKMEKRLSVIADRIQKVSTAQHDSVNYGNKRYDDADIPF